MEYDICITITGKTGTGKTIITKEIIDMLSALGYENHHRFDQQTKLGFNDVIKIKNARETTKNNLRQNK